MDGSPGAFTLRMLVFADGSLCKPRRVEVGLGTADRTEAVWRARVVLRSFYACGAKFSGRLAVVASTRLGRRRLVSVSRLLEVDAEFRCSKRKGGRDREPDAE